MLNRGELDGVRLLAPPMVDFMTCDHLGNIPGRDSLIEAGEGFGLGFAVRTARGQTPVPGPVGTYYWSGMAGTSFFVDPTNNLFAMLLIQAPNQRAYYRQLFRNLVRVNPKLALDREAARCGIAVIGQRLQKAHQVRHILRTEQRRCTGLQSVRRPLHHIAAVSH
eukprot:gene41242-65284_t